MQKTTMTDWIIPLRMYLNLICELSRTAEAFEAFFMGWRFRGCDGGFQVILAPGDSQCMINRKARALTT